MKYKDRCELMHTALKAWGLTEFDSHVLAGVFASTLLPDSELELVAKNLGAPKDPGRAQVHEFMRAKG